MKKNLDQSKKDNSERLADVKRRLNSKSEQQRLAALAEALTCGQEGLDLLLQQALTDQSEKIRQSAYWILHQQDPYLEVTASNEPIFSTDAIACVAISPDCQTLVGGGWQKIRIWDLQTGELLLTLDGHSHWVLSVAISSDGKTLVSGSADKTVKIWDLKTGQLIRQLNAHLSWVNTIVISPDSKTLVSGSADKTIKVWDLNQGKCQRTLKKHSGSVCSLAISSDGKVIGSGSTDKTIKLWDLETGKLYGSLEEHLHWVRAIAISPDSKTLVSVSQDGEIKVWHTDINSEKQFATSQFHKNSLIDKILGFIILVFISKLTTGLVLWIGIIFILILNSLIRRIK